MGIWSAIGGFLSSVVSGIGSVLTAIGLGPVATALNVAFTAVKSLVGLIVKAAPLVTQTVEKLAPQVIEPKEIESGKLAVKAETCKDIKPENHQSTSEYIKAVREDIANNPEKQAGVEERMKNLSPKDETVYKVVSVTLAVKVAAEKLGVPDLDPPFFGRVNAMGLDAGQTISMVKGLHEEKVSISDVNKYFDGSLRGDDFEKADAGIKAVLEKMDPSLQTEDQKNAAINRMADKLDAAIQEEEAKMQGAEDA